MSKILLYLDEDSMDEDFVRALRDRNVDVLTVADAGMLHRTDSGCDRSCLTKTEKV